MNLLIIWKEVMLASSVIKYNSKYDVIHWSVIVFNTWKHKKWKKGRKTIMTKVATSVNVIGICETRWWQQELLVLASGTEMVAASSSHVGKRRNMPRLEWLQLHQTVTRLMVLAINRLDGDWQVAVGVSLHLTSTCKRRRAGHCCFPLVSSSQHTFTLTHIFLLSLKWGKKLRLSLVGLRGHRTPTGLGQRQVTVLADWRTGLAGRQAGRLCACSALSMISTAQHKI